MAVNSESYNFDNIILELSDILLNFFSSQAERDL